ncbi:tyrosine-type recombinase/integrase [Natronomonas gomsonensis]|uniref:tyrosine-type recombinase/integrase n=1 Tax=Natronomonas gomsonensis TaxID=1046043 RepID=UPI0020CA2D37|nr:tyrosine-type recombinase/integrase [Natronomonas gomsonensis]MCY4730038.1 tyrosine-type recombinase/integrase [Natronomonas gomsonensis]
MSDPNDIYPALRKKGASVCTLDELEERYWSEVGPDLRSEGQDPNSERPTYKWLVENGHRDLIYALQEYHDLSFGDFWTQTLGLEDKEPGYNWEIGDEDTIDALETYLERRRGNRWSETTTATHRGRLKQYAGAYYTVNDTDDLLSPIAPDSETPEYEAKDACWRAFERLDDQYKRTTLEKVYRAVDEWYEHLRDRGLATTIPTSAVASNFDWSDVDPDDGSEETIEPNQVRALYDEAHNNRERTLVVALCAWGLRANEVARLHRDQLVLDVDEPYIEFDERKNGPSTVNIPFGEQDAQTRISLLDGDDWGGYLFPSTRSESGHVHRNTVRDWLHDLADRAGVTLGDGDDAYPNPQQARQYWYNAYSEVLEDVLLDAVSELAEEQGSSSAQVVWNDYLSEERRRSVRRALMREKLKAAFGDES